MKWLESHVYIAAWLSPLVALIGMLITSALSSPRIDPARMMIYIAFLTSLAALFTPVLEDGTRFFAGILVAGILAFLMWDAAAGKHSN